MASSSSTPSKPKKHHRKTSDADKKVTAWMLAQDPPLEDWRSRLMAAAKAAIAKDELEILIAMNLTLDQLKWRFKMEFYQCCTLVHEATRFGRVSVLKWLKERGCSILIPPHLQNEIPHPTMVAVWHNQLGVLKWLQSIDDPLLVPNQIPRDLLNLAAIRGHFEIVDWLIENGGGDSKLDKMTSLNLGANSIAHVAQFEAMEARKLFKFSKLLKKPAAWNWALSVAVKYGSVNTLDWMVSRGWKPKKGDEVAIAFHTVLSDSRVEVLRWLKVRKQIHAPTKSDQQRHIRTAVRCGSVELLKELVEGFTEAGPLKLFDPPLIGDASFNPDVDVVKYLYELGCDDGRQTDIDLFLYAARLGRIDILEWISSHGVVFADLTFQFQAVFSASLEGRFKCVRWMHDTLKFPIKENPLGSILCLAAAVGDIDDVAWLVEDIGYDLNQQRDNFTPLATAQMNGNDEVAEYLAARSD